MQTGLGAHPASHSMGTSTTLPGIKRPGCDPHHFLVPRIRICGAMLPLSMLLHGVVLNFRTFSFIGSESRETSALASSCRTSVYLLHLLFRHYTNTVLREVSHSLSTTKYHIQVSWPLRPWNSSETFADYRGSLVSFHDSTNNGSGMSDKPTEIPNNTRPAGSPSDYCVRPNLIIDLINEVLRNAFFSSVNSGSLPSAPPKRMARVSVRIRRTAGVWGGLWVRFLWCFWVSPLLFPQQVKGE